MVPADDARGRLEAALESESDAIVRGEIVQALEAGKRKKEIADSP
jgi:hypothetical protein